MARSRQMMHKIGLRKIQRNFMRVMNIVDDETARGIAHWSFKVIDTAQELVPVDTGELFRSAYVEKPRKTKSGPQGRFGFRAPHAIPVHEATTQQFRNGQRKFLSDAIDKHQKDLVPTLRIYTRGKLKKTLSATVSEG